MSAIQKMDYKKFLSLDLPKNYIVLFSGKVDPITGKNWCPYCTLILPDILEKYMPAAKERDLSKLYSHQIKLSFFY